MSRCGDAWLRTYDLQLNQGRDGEGVAVGYAMPRASLRAYVSTYSLTRVATHAAPVHDQVYPEWANIRFSASGDKAACTGPGPLAACDPVCGIGPTSHATRFALGSGDF